MYSVEAYSAVCEDALKNERMTDPYADIIDYAKQRPLSPGYLMAAHSYGYQGAYDPTQLFKVVQDFLADQGEFPHLITKTGTKYQPGVSRPQYQTNERFDYLVELIKNIVNTNTVIALRSSQEVDALIHKRVYFGFAKSAEAIENLAYSILFLAERYPEVEQGLYAMNHIANYYFNKKLEDWYPFNQPLTQYSIHFGQEAANDGSFLYKNRGMSSRAKNIGAMNAIDFVIAAAFYDIYLMGAVRYAQDLKAINGGLDSPFDQETQQLLRQIKVDKTEMLKVLKNLQYMYALEVFGFIARAKILSYDQYLRLIRYIMIEDLEEEFVMSLVDVPNLEDIIEANDPQIEYASSQDPAYHKELRYVVQSFWLKVKDQPIDLTVKDLQWLAGLAAPRFR